MNPEVEDLQQSLRRCLASADFTGRFYARFLDRDPRIRPLFAQTDLATQQMMLRRGLSVSLSAIAGDPAMQPSFRAMAALHRVGGRVTVDPELYPHWVDCLCETVAESDPQADGALLARWRAVLAAISAGFARPD